MSLNTDFSPLHRLFQTNEEEEPEKKEVSELRSELWEKEMKLTDIRLEALNSAHQLDQLRETMHNMQVGALPCRASCCRCKSSILIGTPVCQSTNFLCSHVYTDKAGCVIGALGGCALRTSENNQKMFPIMCVIVMSFARLGIWWCICDNFARDILVLA